MRSYGGFLLLTGIGVVQFFYLTPPVHNAASHSSQIPPAEFAAPFPAGRFSPSISLSMPAGGLRLSGLANAATPAVTASYAMRWSATVVAAPPLEPTAFSPRDPTAQHKLALVIQQQLRRVGCYWGGIDGSWNSITKDALKEFTDRVNASLPLDKPDYIQLALIQSQSDEICGACPAGHSLSSAGRCIAPTRVAATQKEVLPSKTRLEDPEALRLFKPAPTDAVATNSMGRMALGALVPIDVQQDVPPIALANTLPLIAALDANEVKRQARVAPKWKRRAGSSHGRDRSYDRSRRLADGGALQSTRKPQHMRTGTLRYNLMLSLGGTY